MIKMIQESGIKASCKTALNGETGLKLLHKLDSRKGQSYPDIILLDLDMPIMNGFEFLNEYEKTFFPNHPNTSIYMLSSSILAEDRTKAKMFPSVSNFISKPISLTLIKEILNQLMISSNG